jgi:hypothetical protein
MMGLVLGGWVALRLVMVCLAVPAGAGAGAGGAPAWRADPAAMLAARPGQDERDPGHAGLHGPMRRGLMQGAPVGHGADARPAVPDAAPDILAASTRLAGLGALPRQWDTWHAGLLAVLDEERGPSLRD